MLAAKVSQVMTLSWAVWRLANMCKLVMCGLCKCIGDVTCRNVCHSLTLSSARGLLTFTAVQPVDGWFRVVALLRCTCNIEHSAVDVTVNDLVPSSS